MHIEHREYPDNKLLKSLFREERKCQSTLMSALIKLVSHPSNKLRAAALSFFDVGIANSSMYIIASPACPPDCPSGISLFSTMTIYARNINHFQFQSYHKDLEPVVGELRENMKDELALLLDIVPTRVALHRLLFYGQTRTDELGWTEVFASILIRLSKGRHLSDLCVEALLLFMSNHPIGVKAVIQRDGTFSIEVNGQVKTTLELPTSFISALILTRPHYAAAILTRFHSIVKLIDSAALLMDLKCGWFAKLFEAVNPSKLPFTHEFIPLHTQLVRVMKDYLDKICQSAEWDEHDQIGSELDELYHSFHQHTKDYFVHLSLHPFALISNFNANVILHFFTDFFGSNLENSVSKPFHDEMRKEMDEAALSSSSPPFILTSELVCRITDEEIMNVVDKIVALLESDYPIDDDTILRICAFHSNQLKSVYLPELFRKAGRTTEQYFHALNILISLPLDCFDLHPINTLLTPKPKTLQPTFDEWDDVDLSTVGVVLPTIDENSVSFHTASSQLLKFAIDIVPQMPHCATRLTRSQLERLLSPSINMITTYNLHHETLLYELP
ncbi:hypothetical protein BLNAU_16943 [Blattamonas nauphoetae]|uniref:Uncharacterized protein n=1 Tax=Blattamonas nauphoetae TaxID=2049346 RepID=A0ABQ9X7W6_9EUKA|nr:hypothetical protein BLNAU_16943 [Blattamonas nauphoetae]